MQITEDIRKYVAEQGLSEGESLKNGMEAKSRVFAPEVQRTFHQSLNPTTSIRSP